MLITPYDCTVFQSFASFSIIFNKQETMGFMFWYFKSNNIIMVLWLLRLWAQPEYGCSESRVSARLHKSKSIILYIAVKVAKSIQYCYISSHAEQKTIINPFWTSFYIDWLTIDWLESHLSKFTTFLSFYATLLLPR